MPDSLQTAEFVRLWTLHGQRIYAYLLALSSNYADADEIYQEVGMTLWQKFDQYTPETNFHAWARQVALYKVPELPAPPAAQNDALQSRVARRHRSDR
jgi:DNA-directed RNA polymerase specialized sigma24 family protein